MAGRHVAVDPRAAFDLKNPANTGMLSVVRRGRRRAAAAATGALMIVAPSVASGDSSREGRAEPAPIAPPPPPPAPVARHVAPVVKAPVIPPVKPRAVPAVPKKIAPPPPTSSGKAASIAAAAWAQLGRFQDCTMLATHSLAAAGINFHGWPAGYLTLGHVVPPSQAIAGDLIYYANGGMGVAHVAVYVGNGLAIHGGWNGNQTVSFSANVGSGPVFIRVH